MVSWSIVLLWEREVEYRWTGRLQLELAHRARTGMTIPA